MSSCTGNVIGSFRHSSKYPDCKKYTFLKKYIFKNGVVDDKIFKYKDFLDVLLMLLRESNNCNSTSDSKYLWPGRLFIDLKESFLVEKFFRGTIIANDQAIVRK